MNNVSKGMVAGLAATVVLSMIMLMKGMMGLMPELNVIGMLAGMMKSSATMAWVAHFMIGAIVWGVLFAVLHEKLPGNSSLIKGIVFGIGAWVLMMIAVMPMAGAGMFGMKLGMMAPIMTLMLHAVFGAVLGGVFAKL
jgi:uncharacterized membrane protein YagU involved in acid resistance